MEKLLYGVDEAAQIIGLSKHTVRAYVHRGWIKVTPIGTRVLIPAAELNRIAEEGVKQAA
jgi:excisionase family DNA binding protein